MVFWKLTCVEADPAVNDSSLLTIQHWVDDSRDSCVLDGGAGLDSGFGA